MRLRTGDQVKDIPPDFQILTTIVSQIPVGVVGADSGHGLRRLWAKSVFWVQTLPAQSAVQTPPEPFPRAWSATIFQTVPKTPSDLAPSMACQALQELGHHFEGAVTS